MCRFNDSWAGRCGQPGEPYCAKHTDLKCVSCGKQATQSCGETGQFVCGAPLCDDCEHTLYEDGTNGGIGFNMRSPPEGMKIHCKKSEQRYQPWYARDQA